MNTPGIAMYSVYYQDQLIRTDAVSGLQSQFYLGEQVQDLIAGSQGQLRLAFTGERGFQVKLNEVRFEVEGTRDLPEPAALALVGMALAGAGWASRRRRLS
ncbi:MAG: PEP-CTERM sorting domain-containing protein [Burkholderiales bacterium]|nr:PEP-CTERM sorting domain-containing protein [Burkholderiales bacterium]